MPPDVIDTLEIAHELRDAGLPERQADAIARQFKRRYEADRGELVTREYLDAALDALRIELRAEITGVRNELRMELRGEIAGVRTDIAGLERDLVLKLGGIVTLAVAVVGALGVLF
jgi:hypothetical protein